MVTKNILKQGDFLKGELSIKLYSYFILILSFPKQGLVLVEVAKVFSKKRKIENCKSVFQKKKNRKLQKCFSKKEKQKIVKVCFEKRKIENLRFWKAGCNHEMIVRGKIGIKINLEFQKRVQIAYQSMKYQSVFIN
eukprot:TRINITY_DN10450_c0_g1_i8.p5 TRINITY_DN10450_c0_g1~~TRINITY_DN10450_c0_g1_i8.p5  ORF type:complete len:136 (+),score=6.06 TRINITY_DN10450_c0_g1_i8:1350-1757(+)